MKRAPPQSDAFVGQVVAARYRVVKLLGRGGMGAIYEVEHIKLGRAFALKKLLPKLADDGEAMARFQREADVVSRLRHPNIIEITDWETADDGSPCMIMELLRGVDLHARITAGPMAWQDLARIADQVLSALVVAHRAGIVHRDLKPENIFLTRDDAGEEHVTLLDFGVSKIAHAHARLTDEQRMLGTPGFMAPEQADGRVAEIGPRTDVWAMGAILFEMATGQPAFPGVSAPAILYRVCHGQPEDLRAVRADAPAEFVATVSAALSREEGKRILDAEVLRGRLRAALGAVAVTTAPMRVVAAPERATRRSSPVSARSDTTLSGASGQTVRTRRVGVGGLGKVGLAGGAGAVAVLAVVAWLALRGRGKDAEHATATPASAVATTAPATTAPATTAPASTAPATTAPATTAPASGKSAAAAAPRRTIALRRFPPEARATLDGVDVSGRAVLLPLDGRAHLLHVTARGFAPRDVALDASSPSKLAVSLRALGRPQPSKRSVRPLDP
jgi:eukaryotic-like serine/threonine-protein kinase